MEAIKPILQKLCIALKLIGLNMLSSLFLVILLRLLTSIFPNFKTVQAPRTIFAVFILGWHHLLSINLTKSNFIKVKTTKIVFFAASFIYLLLLFLIIG